MWEVFKTKSAITTSFCDKYSSKFRARCNLIYSTFLLWNFVSLKWNTRKNAPCSIIFHLIWINLGCKIIYSLRRIHYCREIRARLLLQIILHFCLGWLIWHKMSGQRLVFDPKILPMVINVSVGLIKDHMNIDLNFNSE